MQVKFAFGGSILSLSQFMLLPHSLKKTMTAITLIREPKWSFFEETRLQFCLKMDFFRGFIIQGPK
jgi:hypothetical protein